MRAEFISVPGPVLRSCGENGRTSGRPCAPAASKPRSAAVVKPFAVAQQFAGFQENLGACLVRQRPPCRPVESASSGAARWRLRLSGARAAGRSRQAFQGSCISLYGGPAAIAPGTIRKPPLPIPGRALWSTPPIAALSAVPRAGIASAPRALLSRVPPADAVLRFSGLRSRAPVAGRAGGTLPTPPTPPLLPTFGCVVRPPRGLPLPQARPVRDPTPPPSPLA